MTDNKLTSSLSLDSTDFKTQIASINRELRVMESEFRANAAGLGDWSNDASGLEARMKSLNGQIDLQQKKVNALSDEYGRVADEKGENSKAAQELQIKLNKETETLNKMSNELKNSESKLQGMGEEADKTGKDVEQLGESEKKAEKDTKSLGSALEGLKNVAAGVGKAVAAVGAAAVGAVAGLATMVVSASDAAGKLVDLSNQTGISVEQLQEMKYVGDQLGVPLETMEKSLTKLTKNMGDASEGTGTAVDAFEKLGISVTNSDGSLRDARVVYQEAIDALGGMSNETERDAAAMDLFGKSAMDLNPLIKAGADEISALTEEAHEIGAVMDTEAVEGLESFGDSLASMKAGIQGNLGMIASAIMPTFQGIVDLGSGYMKEFAGIISGSEGDLSTAGPQLGDLLGRIVSDVATKIPNLLQAGLAVIKGLVQAIVDAMPEIIPAVIQILSSLVGFITEMAPMLVEAAIPLITEIMAGISEMLPMLIESAIAIMVTLIEGLTEALPQLIDMITTLIPAIIDTLISNLPLLIPAALELIIALVNGLIAAVPTLVAYVPEMVVAIFDAFITALPMIADAAVELIVTLVTGIVDMLPQLATAAQDIIDALVDGIEGLATSLWEAGKNIVNGVWDGISGAYEDFKSKVSGFFSGIVGAVKDALGIKSPSTVFAGIGQNMALGLGFGFMDSLGNVERDIASAVGSLAPSVSGSLALSGAASGAASGPINITVQAGGYSNMDLDILARTLVRKIERARR